MLTAVREIAMPESIANGTRREIDGRPSVFYDGYWIKWYDPPPDSEAVRTRLIKALTRRLFNHVEHGINIPGFRLKEARQAYEREADPERKRVNGAMLAGALFNRAGDIFTKVVELKAVGVEIAPDDPLMRECGQCLLEALDLGKIVRHRSGDEGIDELWGEPFKAFTQPIETFYTSRYIKMAQAMRDIDRVGAAIIATFVGSTQIVEIAPRIHSFTEAAKRKCEILRTDPAIFEVWPAFVVATEHLCKVQPTLPPAPTRAEIREAQAGTRLIQDGTALVTHIVRARVAMPVSTREYLDRCQQFRRLHLGARHKVSGPSDERLWEGGD
jgi:hypothetical protein